MTLEENLKQIPDLSGRPAVALETTVLTHGMPYPQMKMLDMGFWQIGFELDTKKGLQVPLESSRSLSILQAKVLPAHFSVQTRRTFIFPITSK